MKRSALLLVLLTIITSCKTMSFVSVMKKGSYNSTTDVVEVKYETMMEIMIVPVVIGDRTFRFMFDTGAPNVVTHEVAALINSSKKVKQKVSDSSDKSQNLNFIEIPLLKIGEASFLNTGAAISDFNQSNVLKCFNVDGIIGANLMRTCHVQIDYLSNVIRFSKDKSLLLKEEGFEIPFTAYLQGTPYISFKIGDQKMDKLMIDTGYNGFLNLNSNKKSDIQPALVDAPRQQLVGSTTEGIFGSAVADTTTNYWFGSYHLDSVPVSAAGLISFQNTESNLLGNEFLKNFITTYDWQKKTVHFSPIFKTAQMPKGYPIGLIKEENELVVTWINLESEEYQLGIRPKTRVLMVDEIDTRIMTSELFCTITDLMLQKRPQLNLTVLLNGQEKVITIERKDLF